MKTRSLILATAVVVLGACSRDAPQSVTEVLGPEFAKPGGGGSTITWLDLGSLGTPPDVVFAWSINSTVQVTGSSTTDASGQHAFLWESGVMRDLGTLGSASDAFFIHDNGTVVGRSFVSPQSSVPMLPMFWTSACGMVALNLLEGGNQGTAFGMNGSGLIVGWSNRLVSESSYSSFTVAWTVQDCGVARMDSLGPSLGYPRVSETGRVVVGNTYYEKDGSGQWQSHVFASAGSQASDINASGTRIVGVRYTDASLNAGVGLVWTEVAPGVWVEEQLPGLGGPLTEARGTSNTTSDIVGMSRDARGRRRAVRWTSRAGGGWNIQDLGGPGSSSANRAQDVVNLADGTAKIAGDARGASSRAILWTVR